VNLNLFSDLRKRHVERRGLPHLAKNERDMGHAPHALWATGGPGQGKRATDKRLHETRFFALGYSTEGYSRSICALAAGLRLRKRELEICLMSACVQMRFHVSKRLPVAGKEGCVLS
jgi:hypothetical protein